MEWIVPILTALGGAAIGYYLRSAEFRRDQRLKVYSDYVGAFMDAAGAGVDVLQLHLHLGDKIHTTPAALPVFDKWSEAYAAYHAASTQLRLIGSAGARSAAAPLDDFLVANVSAPLRRHDPKAVNGEAWNTGGPRGVEQAALDAARTFTDKTRTDIVGRLHR